MRFVWAQCVHCMHRTGPKKMILYFRYRVEFQNYKPWGIILGTFKRQCTETQTNKIMKSCQISPPEFTIFNTYLSDPAVSLT